MAYLDFSTLHRPDVPSGGQHTRIAPQAVFSGLEWTVIALARSEKLSSLAAPGRLSRAFGGLFGFGAASRLADDRLEALRRFAIQAWHRRGGVTAADRQAFLDTGYSSAQLAALLSSVARSGLDRLRSASA